MKHRSQRLGILERALKKAGISYYLKQVPESNVVRVVDGWTGVCVWRCEIRHLRAYMRGFFESDAPVDAAMEAIAAGAQGMEWSGHRT